MFPFLCWGYRVSLRSCSAGKRRVLGGHLQQVCLCLLCRMPFVQRVLRTSEGRYALEMYIHTHTHYKLLHTVITYTPWMMVYSMCCYVGTSLCCSLGMVYTVCRKRVYTIITVAVIYTDIRFCTSDPQVHVQSLRGVCPKGYLGIWTYTAQALHVHLGITSAKPDISVYYSDSDYSVHTFSTNCIYHS